MKNPPIMTSQRGVIVRQTLTVLARMDTWVSSYELGQITQRPSASIGATLCGATACEYVIRRMEKYNKAEWKITQKGKNALSELPVELPTDISTAQIQRARRKKYVPAFGSTASRCIAYLRCRSEEWVCSVDMAKHANTKTTGLVTHLEPALAAGLVIRKYVNPRKTLWRLSPLDQIEAAEIAHKESKAFQTTSTDDLAALERADMLLQAQRAAAWVPLPGTVVSRALQWMQTQPVGAQIEPVMIGAAIDAEPKDVVIALGGAVRAGLLQQAHSARDVRVPVYRLAASGGNV